MTETSKLNIERGSRYSRLYTLTILLSPILRQYVSGIPGVTLAELTLGISCMLLLMNNGLKISFKKIKPLMFLWFIGILLSLISFLIQQSISFEAISRLIRFSYYVCLIFVASRYFQLRYAVKVLKFLTLAVSIYIVLQIVVYNLEGIVLPFKVLPFPLGRDIDIEYMTQFASTYYLRPTGIFVEPGYVAQFLLPGLALSLFGWLENDKVDIKNVILILLALILTTSSQGVFLGGLILSGFLFHRIKSNKSYSGVIKNIILIAIMILLFKALLNLDNVQLALNKVTGEIRSGSSYALRIYRGFAVFAELPLIYKIIGVGHGNLGSFVIDNGIFTKFDPINITMSSAEYTNGISSVLLYYGIIGFAFFLNLYMSFFRKTKNVFRVIFILLIGVSFVANITFDVLIIFYYSLIYAGMESCEINKL